MIFLTYFSILALALRRHGSIAFLLCVMLAGSALAGVLIGVSAPVRSALDLFNIFYTLLVLTIFIAPFRHYAHLREIVPGNRVKVSRVVRVLIFIGTGTAAVNGYVFYSAMSAGIESYELFKNSGLGNEFTYSLPISHSFVTLASWLSPVAYPLLGLGFYYASARKVKLAAICFLLSLNMPLQGFTVFSRSWSVMYLCLLVAYLWYSLYVYTRRFRRKLVLLALAVTVPVLLYLVEVTQNRFSDAEVTTGSVVGDPRVYWILNYYSMWNANGVTVMSDFYSIDAIQYGGSTNTLIPYVYDLLSRFVFGVDNQRENELVRRARIWPDAYPSLFNGLVTNLVFDFGYILTVAFAVLYARVTKRLAPRKGETSLFAYLNFGLVVVVPMLSMFGNYFSVLYYNLGIVYSLAIGCYLRFRLKPVPVRQAAHDMTPRGMQLKQG